MGGGRRRQWTVTGKGERQWAANNSLMENQMGRIRLGINTCFAIKRYSEPEEWAGIVGEELGVKEAQFSADLLDPLVGGEVRAEMVRRTVEAAARHYVNIHSVFSGVGVQAGNLLLHWEEGMRNHGLNWYRGMVEIASGLGAEGCGGILGSHTFRQMAEGKEMRRVRALLVERWRELADYGAEKGIAYLMTEPMSVAREYPSGMEDAEEVYGGFNSEAAIPTYFCLDVGHLLACSGTEEDRDPYAWIGRFGSRSRAVHLQQTDGRRSHHWPFTREYNKIGIIKGEKLLEAIAESGAEDLVLFLEVFHANFEPFDTRVLDDLKASVEYWRRFVPG